jgi:hypothetical protein
VNDQKPEVTRRGALSMQVCVPEGWTDDEVKALAEFDNPCGTTNGWGVRKAGSPLLAGAPERRPCADRPGFVHVMLDA